jgi:Fic-DOC domain mobile mystery protein B
MGLDLYQAEGQTPLDEDEKEGLLIPTITMRGELDEFEQLGVEKGVEWSMRKKPTTAQMLTEDFLKELHKKMFSDVWKWAGEFRTSNKNLSSDSTEIRTEMRKLLDDCSYWIEHAVFPPDEIVVRFSHRLVAIHPFPNGNGRHSRLTADILVHYGLGRLRFSWGQLNLTKKGEARTAYLAALKEADGNNYTPLIAFARM